MPIDAEITDNAYDVQAFDRKGKGKLLPLEEAVRCYVKPGMKLHLAGGIGGPSAAICELLRQRHFGKTHL